MDFYECQSITMKKLTNPVKLFIPVLISVSMLVACNTAATKSAATDTIKTSGYDTNKTSSKDKGKANVAQKITYLS